MTEHQQNLFPDQLGTNKPRRAKARRTDPETSHEAAESLTSFTLSDMELRVMAALQQEGDMIAEDLCYVTGLPWQTLTPRLATLRRKGVIEDSGTKRKASSGRSQIIWRLC